MKTNLALIKLYFIIVLLRTLLANSDVPLHFCGTHLSNFLGSRCKLYNKPANGILRNRRQIVEECCWSPCSLRYLLCTYCAHTEGISCTNLAAATTVSTNAQKGAFH